MNKPQIHMMLGLPGSGKTTFSKQLAKSKDIEHFSLDEEYFALVNNSQQKQRDKAIEYEVEEKIKAKISEIISINKSVVLDFCPWRKQERDNYISWLCNQGAEPVVYYFDVPLEELLKRLKLRNQEKSNKQQYMTPEMLDDFSKIFDPPAPSEAVFIT